MYHQLENNWNEKEKTTRTSTKGTPTNYRYTCKGEKYHLNFKKNRTVKFHLLFNLVYRQCKT